MRFKTILQVLSLSGRRHSIAFEPDHYSFTCGRAQKLLVSKHTSPRKSRASPRPRRAPEGSLFWPRPHRHRPGPREPTRPLGLPWGPCPAPRAELGPARPIQRCCGQSMTNFTRSPTTLLAKTSRFLLVPEVAPWGPARLSPSQGPQHPRRGPRRLGPHTRRGRGGSRVLGARQARRRERRPR